MGRRITLIHPPLFNYCVVFLLRVVVGFFTGVSASTFTGVDSTADSTSLVVVSTACTASSTLVSVSLETPSLTPVASWAVDVNYHTFEILYTNKSIDFYIDRALIHSFTQTSLS